VPAPAETPDPAAAPEPESEIYWTDERICDENARALGYAGCAEWEAAEAAECRRAAAAASGAEKSARVSRPHESPKNPGRALPLMAGQSQSRG